MTVLLVQHRQRSSSNSLEMSAPIHLHNTCFKIVTLFNAYLYNALHTRTNPVPINPLLHYFGWAESPRLMQFRCVSFLELVDTDQGNLLY